MPIPMPLRKKRCTLSLSDSCHSAYHKQSLSIGSITGRSNEKAFHELENVIPLNEKWTDVGDRFRRSRLYINLGYIE